MADNSEKDQKTEEATPRRREEAREKGQVPMSTELIAAVGLCVGLGAFLLGGANLLQAAAGAIVGMASSLSSIGTGDIDVVDSANIIEGSLMSVAGALSFVVMPAILVGGLVGYGQVGFRISGKAMEFDPEKISPIKGWSRLISMRAVVRTALAGAKVILITLVVASVAWWHVEEIGEISTNEIGPLMLALSTVAVRCVAAALIVILLLALVDLVYQRFQHGKDLRMTKQEVKEEHKMTEGDPHVRARVRQIQREMATQRMMAEVPEATVVVTNPTHYAVALKYEAEGAAGAPRVVAKGVDHLAQHIKSVAADAGVVLYEDVPLARSLYARVDVGDEIPEDLFAAVATVIGYVYRLNGSAAAA